jgi:hypothetical protein
MFYFLIERKMKRKYISNKIKTSDNLNLGPNSQNYYFHQSSYFDQLLVFLIRLFSYIFLISSDLPNHLWLYLHFIRLKFILLFINFLKLFYFVRKDALTLTLMKKFGLNLFLIQMLLINQSMLMRKVSVKSARMIILNILLILLILKILFFILLFLFFPALL